MRLRPAVFACLALLALAALSLASCKKTPARALQGAYRTTWGPAMAVSHGNEIAIAYPRGTMICQVSDDDRLACRWQSGAASGRASFARAEKGLLRGTWGFGESDSDGGAWAMVAQ